MGSGFARNLIYHGLISNENLTIVGSASTRARDLGAELGCPVTLKDYSAVSQASCVLIAVKNKDFETVLRGLAPHLAENVVIISTVTGVSFAKYREIIGTKGCIVTIVPNPAFEFGRSLSIVLEENRHLSPAQREFIQALFATGGEVFKADSNDARQLPTASAISGCGPAFVAQFVKDCFDTHAESIEGIDATLNRFLEEAKLGVDICKNADDPTLISLSVFRSEILESGVLHGFTVEQSNQLFLGAIDGYLSIRSHGATPEQAIRKVATPGGTTEAALKYAHDVNQDLSQKPWTSVISLAAARMGSPFPNIQKK